MNFFKASTVLFLLLLFSSLSVFAYKVPEDLSNVEFFYVFGPEGEKLMGADDNQFSLYIDVPEEEVNDLVISVFDPDTYGRRDWPAHSRNGWNTVTKFSIYGESLLDEKEFSTEGDYDYFDFGPYDKNKGKNIGGFYRFRVDVQGLKGDDANLFKFKISPESAESFSYNLTFRLAPNYGDKMYFFPYVSADTKKITVENYDLDQDGGTSVLYDTASWGSALEAGGKFDINDSNSGEWKTTPIDIVSGQERRLEYVITKAIQRNAHAGLKIYDDKGNLLPIYFRRGHSPVSVVEAPRPKPVPVAEKPTMQCNVFTFDATSSYDPDNQNLSYLWSFGDGQTSKEPVVTHTYQEGGDYVVTLTVVDSSGLECDTAVTSQNLQVNTPPSASFTALESGCTGKSLTFDASGSSDNTPENLTYSWNFGDGTTDKGEVVSKTFSKGGTYKVTLLVDDGSGTSCNADLATAMIEVNSPPTASAGRDVELCLDSFDESFNVVFDASGSSDPERDELNYMWNFGDGENGEGKRVSHTYKKSGSYDVQLIVSDASGTSCSTDSDTLTVNLNKRPDIDAGEDRNACVGDVILFKGDSQSYNADDFSYTWDFGDGTTSSEREVQHKYTKGGKYRVALTVDDEKDTVCSRATDVLQVTVNSAPGAKLQEVAKSCAGYRVNFDASASNDPDSDRLTYLWDFGDGTTEKGTSKASHTYLKGGSYTVSVKVDDNKASACSSDRDVIVAVVNTPPVADAGPNLVCCEGKVSEFDASGSYDPDGDTLSYDWDFGDGESAQGMKVQHVYEKRGTYDVVLTVDDGSGTSCSSDTSGFTANVNAMPVPVIKVR
ncbi:MAG: PKD domain-containing protein [Candidatus Omnitrophica bacterium]|nr:PKD domain-containing protein [Candidatus Omnitrophota bacterium]